MADWQNILKNSITDPQHLTGLVDPVDTRLAEVVARYPMRVNSYYLHLAKSAGAPLLKQALPDTRELDDPVGMVDPLGEEDLSPVPGLVHKYPDRVLFWVCSECAMYCRFCTRKRKVGRAQMRISDQTIEAGLDYLKKTPSVREVLLSGGDPLLLSDNRLEGILNELKKIRSIEVIRIGSRVVCTLPMRITDNLVAMLQKYQPLYINTHFNHPAEITDEARAACAKLADAGIVLGCQTVLLRGINNDPAILRQLFATLLTLRVRPYYLFQTDLTRGTNHFRTSIQEGLAIMEQLIGHLSGMAVPTYAVDAPGGGGKIPLTPDKCQLSRDGLHFHNFHDKPFFYPNP
jgi:lysine 2,3-aminomutase